jgi:hypothetical protein
MRTRKARNVFESSGFCYLFCKFVYLLFITVGRDEKGKFYSVTTRMDKINFAIGIAFFVVNLIFNTNIIVDHSSIFEIGMLMSFKWSYALPLFVMIGTFYYRHEFFYVLMHFHWIDVKVNSRSSSWPFVNHFHLNFSFMPISSIGITQKSFFGQKSSYLGTSFMQFL